MIDMKFESSRKLSTQDIYDIIDTAVRLAEDDGFINEFILERVLYECMALVVLPNRKDEIVEMMEKSPLSAWDTLVEDGTIEMLCKDYRQEIAHISDLTTRWVASYGDHIHSMRGMLSYMNDLTSKLTKTLEESVKKSDIPKVLEVADKWGMNNEDK